MRERARRSVAQRLRARFRLRLRLTFSLLYEPSLTRLDDYDGMEREVLDAADQLVINHPKVRAIVLECTNMPPFTHAVEKATGLKVWDVLSLGKWLYEGAAPRDYRKAK